MTKKTTLPLLAVWILLAAFTLEKEPMVKKPVSDKGFAVVELFTSEGCSSCPPADALIARIEKETKGQQVYILAYHVDYWNRLGWKDVFSSPEYSKRQNRYAGWLSLNTVYTPQIVVNGTTEFIGSNQDKLRKAIDKGLQQDTGNAITLSPPKLENDKVSIHYQITGKTSGMQFVLAEIRPSALSKVSRGENAGRTLSHVQIVSSFQAFPLNGKAEGTTETILSGEQIKAGEFIVLLQETKTGRIVAAAKTALL